MARRKDHNRDELRHLILDAAWKIVESEGEGGLTARRIAVDIGYAPGSIYNVFPSMEDVVLHVNGKTLDLLHATLSDPACHNPKKTTLQNLHAMTQRYNAFAVEYYPFWMTLFSSRLQTARFENTWYAEKVDILFHPLENLLRPLFTARQDKALKLHARILWSSVHGITYLATTGKLPVGKRPNEALQMAEHLVTTYLQGLGSKS